MKTLTIVTPTYNREDTLKRAYYSLLAQTNKDFLWLIIDDGSKDNTEKLIDLFKAEGILEIEYIKKENGGKASALNLGLDLIETPYCTCLDSDDWFPEKTVETATKLLDEERNNSKCCGVLGLKATEDQKVAGGKEIPKTYKYIDIEEIYFDCKIQSEFATFYKSEIAKQYRFPVIKGEKFMPPSWFHYAVSEKYKFRVSRDILCLFEYMNDGLTKNKRNVIVKNPVSYTLIKKISFSKSKTLKQKFKNGIMYVCGCIISNDHDWLKNAPFKLISILSFPIAYIVYLKRFKKLEGKIY